MKLVVEEPGTGQARDIWRSAGRKVSSRLLYVEARAGLARAERARRVSRRAAADARALVDGLWEEIDRVDVSEGLVRRAGALADRYGLRAHDAVHLASCESVDGDVGVLIAADRELVAAAREHGISTMHLP